MYKPTKSKHKRSDKKNKDPSSNLHWDESNQKYYRSYVDSHGNQVSEWVDDSTPRGGRDDLQDLTHGVDNLSVSSRDHYQTTTQSYEYPTAPSVPEAEELSSSPTYTHSHAHSSAKGKATVYSSETYEQYPNTYASSTGASVDSGYGTAHAYGQSPTAQHASPLPTYQQDPSTTTAGAASADTTWDYRGASDPRAEDVHPTNPTWGYPRSTQTGSYGQREHGYGGYDAPTTSHHSTTGATDEYDQELHDAELNEALKQSKDQYYHPSRGGESSSAYGSSSTYATPSSYGSSYGYDPAQEDTSTLTPRAGSPVYVSSSKDHITGTGGAYEELDPRYRVEMSTRFQPGEVFKILWSEPMGQGGRDIDAHTSDIRELQHLDQRFYVGFRRFIVVANDEGHCTCVPILTYERKGCAKKGVKANRHGMIYTSSHKPSLLKNEPSLGYAPVRMRISAEGEKLAKESRINYSKLVTIEHNVKVFFIGSVSNDDWYKVQDAVNDCWERKMHHSRKKHK